jgi:hypothetical protein
MKVYINNVLAGTVAMADVSSGNPGEIFNDTMRDIAISGSSVAHTLSVDNVAFYGVAAE